MTIVTPKNGDRSSPRNQEPHGNGSRSIAALPEPLADSWLTQPRFDLAQGPAGALVIGGDYQGLGIVRSLGRRGIPVGVVDDERSIARYSRYAAFAEQVPTLMDAERSVQSLLAVGRRRQLRGWLLYPTRDETVAAISRHREELSEFFRVSTPCWDSVKWLWDKRNTYRLAKQIGIPIPRTWFLSEMSSLDEFDGDYPVALKPAIKEHFMRSTGAKAWRADSKVELQQLVDRAMQFMPRDEILIQDLIPGDGSHQYSYCSFFKRGGSLATLVACRRRQHPFEFGRASTYVESIEMPLLESLSEQFLQAINFYGLVEVEYKLDPRDGQYRLLDVNGRTWGYHTIGMPAGIDFSFLLFADQSNRSIDPARGRPGVRWIRLLTDLPTGTLGLLSGRLDWRHYVHSLRNYDEEAVFSEDDPLPGLMEVALVPYLFFKRGF